MDHPAGPLEKGTCKKCVPWWLQPVAALTVTRGGPQTQVQGLNGSTAFPSCRPASPEARGSHDPRPPAMMGLPLCPGPEHPGTPPRICYAKTRNTAFHTPRSPLSHLGRVLEATWDMGQTGLQSLIWALPGQQPQQLRAGGCPVFLESLEKLYPGELS
jgi:hypothetical protein